MPGDPRRPRHGTARTRWRLPALALAGAVLLGACGPRRGAAVYVPLPFNATAFGRLGGADPSDAATGTPAARYDREGDALSASGAPPAGQYQVDVYGQRIPFEFPPTGSATRTALALDDGRGATLTLAAGTYSALYVLAAAGDGPALLDANLEYADGTSTVAAVISDGCAGQAQGQDTVQAWRATTLLTPSGTAAAGRACGLWVTRIALDPSRVLRGVTLVNAAAGTPVEGTIARQDARCQVDVVAMTLWRA